MSVKISIIIPCYNDAEFIEKSVQSALDQTYENKEVIVVDDGSNEETKVILKSLEPKVTFLLTQKNKGTSAARNAGIEVATGEYILVLDSDDYFHADFCIKAIEIFSDNPDIKIVTCYSNWFNNKTQKTFKPEGGTIKNILTKNIAMGSSMIKKQDWLLVKGYDEKMLGGYEDWEFYLRLLKSGGKAEVIPEILFNYRNKINSRNKQANIKKYELLEYIFLKHADIYKEHYNIFIPALLKSIKNSETYKQQVLNSLDYKVGNKFLKPLRIIGFFKRKK